MLTPFHRAIGIAAVACIGVGCASEHQTMSEVDHLELRIHAITPGMRSIEFDGSWVYATAIEYRALRRLRGAQLRVERCDILVTLVNHTERSYLLSDNSLRALFTRCIELTDARGGRWEIADTFLHGHPDTESLTIPAVARGERSWVYVVGLSRLTQPGANEVDNGAFPTDGLEYRIRPGTKVWGRSILDTELGEATQVPIVGTGRCRVTPDGPAP